MKNPKHFHNNHALHSNKYDEIQDFTWIFRLLWSLLDAKEHNDVNNCDFGKHFKLNIPDTVIFSDGTPTIWLATKPNGFIYRKTLHENNESISVKTKNLEEYESVILQQIFIIIDEFDRFQQQLGNKNAIEKHSLPTIDLPFCIVWYADNKQEYISKDAFINLLPHEDWRKQVICIQAYLKPKQIRTGKYYADKMLQNKDQGGKNAAFNLVTKSLAALLEKKIPFCNIFGHNKDFNQLKIGYLQAEFIIDAYDHLWFSYLSTTKVKYIKSAHINHSSLIKCGIDDEAHDAMIQLKNLLQLARNRKVGPEKWFSHFDVNGVGYVDSEGFKDGLQRLGINVKDEAINIMMESIGSVSGLQFRCKDLSEFVSNFSHLNRNDLKRIERTSIDTDRMVSTVEETNRNDGSGDMLIDEEIKVQIVEDTKLKQTRQNKKSESDQLEHEPSLEPKQPSMSLLSNTSTHMKQNNEIVKQLSINEQVVETANNIPHISDNVATDKTHSSCESFFHSPDGFIIAYRIIDIKRITKIEDDQRMSTIEKKNHYKESLKVLQRKSRCDKKEEISQANCIFIHDILLAPEIDEILQDVLSDTGGSALIIKLPGLPNTSWPSDSILNNTTHSHCFGNLLLHLLQRNLWMTNSRKSFSLIGIGIGASAVLHFTSKLIFEPKYNKIRDFFKGSNLIIVNGLLRCNEFVAKSIKEFKTIIFKKIPENEFCHKLSWLLFSKHHFHQNERFLEIAQFWGLPQLQMLESNDEKLTSRVNLGLNKLLDGIQKTEDISASIHQIESSHVYIQSSKDRFFDPHDICTYNQSMSNKDQKYLHSPQNQGFIWVDAGHAILEDNKEDFLSVLRSKINDSSERKKSRNFHSTKSFTLDNPKSEVNKYPNIDADQVEKSHKNPSTNQLTYNGTKCNLLQKDESHIRENYQDSIIQEDRLQLQNMIRNIEKKERIKSEKERCNNEIHLMRQEEKLAWKLATFSNKNIKRNFYAHHLQNKAKKLRESIDIVNRTDAEDNIKRSQAMERNKNDIFFSELKRKRTQYENDEEKILIEIQKVFDPLNLKSLHSLCDILIESVNKEVKCRHKYEADKHSAFNEAHLVEQECDRVDKNYRKINRAIRKFESRSSQDTLDARVDQTKLKDALEKEFEKLSDLKAIKKRKNEELDYCNAIIQNYHIFIRKRCESLKKILCQIDNQIKNHSEEIKNLRQYEENNIIKEEKRMKTLKSMQERKARIKKEALRIESITETYIESDLWHNVMQIMPTKQFEKRIKHEQLALESQIDDLLSESGRSKCLLLKMQEKSKKKGKEKEELVILHDKIITTTQKSSLHPQSNLHISNEKSNAVAVVLNTETSIRRKSPKHRTAEEQKWVSIDHKINPTLYRSDIVLNSPGYFFIDPRNDLNLNKESVERIINLPEQIQLAIPFIKSNDELECHKIWNKISRGRGEEYFKRLDISREMNLNSLFEVGVINVHLAKLIEIIEIIQKLWRSNRIKALSQCSLSKEQKDWLKVSELLSKNTYGKKLSLKSISHQFNMSEQYLESLIKKFDVELSLTLRRKKNNPMKIFSYKEINLRGSLNKNNEIPIVEEYRAIPGYERISRHFFNPFKQMTEKESSRISLLKKVNTFYKSLSASEFENGNSNSDDYIVDDYEGILPLDINYKQNFIIKSNLSVKIIDTSNRFLEAKHSHCHRFCVKNDENYKLIKVIVSAVYQGSFSSNKYSPGSLSMSMSWLPIESSSDLMLPIPIGVASYDQVAINTRDGIGRIAIEYYPQRIIKEGRFEIMIKAESASKYSLNVKGIIGEQFLSSLKETLISFHRAQENVERNQKMSKLISSDMRLAERKISILKKSMEKLENESINCEHDIEECDAELERNFNVSEVSMTSIQKEIKTLELEYIHWCKLHSIRLQDLQETKENIQVLAEMRRHIMTQIKCQTQKISNLRNVLPLVVAVVFNPEKSIEVAKLLGSNFEEMETLSKTYNNDKMTQIMTHLRSVFLTPAEKVRQRVRKDGFKCLTLEEKKWCIIDISLNPHFWDWITKTLINDDGDHRSDEIFEQLLVIDSSILVQFKLKKDEIDKILRTPYVHLEKTDKAIWKLIKKFHDIPELKTNENFDQTISNVNLAPQIRSKHPKDWSSEEVEWTSIDKILNPDAWLWLKMRPSKNIKTYTYSCHKSIDSQILPSATWSCPFTRDKIIDIWSSEKKLCNDEEMYCKRLLLKYNGTYFKRNEAYQKDRKWKALKNNKFGIKEEKNIYARCHQVLNEIDRAKRCKNKLVSSSIMHDSAQQFSSDMLLLDLERELDRLIEQQIDEKGSFYPPILFDQEDQEDGDILSEDRDDILPLSATSEKEKKFFKRIARVKKVTDTHAQNLMHYQVQGLKKKKRSPQLNDKENIARTDDSHYANDKINPQQLIKRKDELSEELLHIKQNPDKSFFQSFVAKSAQKGGNTHFERQNLIHELTWEKVGIENKLKLKAVDEELHVLYSSRKKFVEVKSLHGYSTTLMLNEALYALERERNKLIAISVSDEVIDNILSWMLDGWYFGERNENESNFCDVKKDKNNLLSYTSAINNEKFRCNNVPIQGAPSDNIATISKMAEDRTTDENISNEARMRKNNLAKIEINIKFGLFYIVFMYFRSIHLVRREKKSWSVESGKCDKQKNSILTAERKKMIKEEENRIARKEAMQYAMNKARIGEARKCQRKEKELEEKGRILHENATRRKKESSATLIIQRIYRGHLGRIAAKRWALKKSEINAMNVLMNGCAIAISRTWRGHRGRVGAKKLRKDMAEFIIRLRADDIKEEEEYYWRTHQITRWTRRKKAK